jgi:FKBP-type peptidyl-prolyl cis-trans isomerase (trigger factor)
MNNKKNKYINIIESKKDKGSQLDLTLNIKGDLINEAINKGIDELSANKEIKGFRKGKAPRELIYTQYKEDIIKNAYTNVQNTIINSIYDSDITPMRIYFKEDFINNIKLNAEDFNIEMKCYQKPKIKKVDLSKVKIKKDEAKKKFDKEKNKYEKENNEEVIKDLKENEERYLNNVYESLIIESLLTNIIIEKDDIPEYMITEHIKKSIDNLESFAKDMNLTLKKYLSQNNTSQEKITEDLEKEVIDQLKLDLFTEEFAKENKIEVTKEDIDTQLKTMSEEEMKNINAEELIYNIRYYKSLKEAVNLIKNQS